MTQMLPRKITKSSVIAHAGIFTSIYLFYGFSSGVIVGPQLHGLDVHVARGFLMALLASRLGRSGGPTLMGLISGVLLTGIPGPSSAFLFPASLAAGVVYDSLMKIGEYARNTSSPVRIMLATSVSGLAESAVVTGGFTAFGFFGPMSNTILIYTWLFLMGRNLVLSAVGGGLAVAVLRTRKGMALRSAAVMGGESLG